MKTAQPPQSDELQNALDQILSSLMYCKKFGWKSSIIDEVHLQLVYDAAKRTQQAEKERDEFRERSTMWSGDAGKWAGDCEVLTEHVDQLKSDLAQCAVAIDESSTHLANLGEALLSARDITTGETKQWWEHEKKAFDKYSSLLKEALSLPIVQASLRDK